MGLRIDAIQFDRFRNYRSFYLGDIADLTVFVGHNAVGKTNIIEGIQLVTSLTSLRAATPGQLVQWDQPSGRVLAKASSSQRQLEIEMRLEDGKRSYLLNGKAKKAGSLKGLVPSVVFSPDDLGLVKGPHSGKRAALDALGSQLRASYNQVRNDYEKVVKYKNRLLKEGSAPGLYLESINDTLVKTGAQLISYRSALFGRLAAHLTSRYLEITGGKEPVRAVYLPSWAAEAEMSGSFQKTSREEALFELGKALGERREEECARRRALVGPHADRIEFFINNRNARVYASQGQQRSLVLSFKLAEAALIEEIQGQRPILLLDDVMSELDARRRGALVQFISGDIQTFITTTNLHYFTADILGQAQVVTLGEPAGPGEGEPPAPGPGERQSPGPDPGEPPAPGVPSAPGEPPGPAGRKGRT